MDNNKMQATTERICAKCGKASNAGAKFCAACGARFEDQVASPVTETSEPTQAAAPEASPVNTTHVNAVPEAAVNTAPVQTVASNKPDVGARIKEIVKKIPPKVAAIVAAALVVIIATVVIIVNAGKTINLDKYVTFEEEGYDGYGTLKATIDWDAIEEKYGEKIKYSSKFKKEAKEGLGLSFKELNKIEELFPPVDALKASVKIELDENEKISNNQTVKYTWDVDEDTEEYLNCKLKFKDGEYTVTGLTEVGSFDVFDDVTITYAGIAPNGEAELSYSGSEFSEYDFDIDPRYHLSNGDSVKVQFGGNTDPEYYAVKFGKIPVAFEKTYTVEGLDEYVSEYSSLDDAFIDTLKSEADDSIRAYVASNYSEESSLGDLEYAGYIFNSIKQADSWYSYNEVYIIYAGIVSNSENKFSAQKVYFPVCFKNVLKSGSDLSFESKEGIKGSSSLGGSWWYSTSGYTNPLICYSDLVEAKRDSYNSECGDGFEVFAEYDLIENLSDIGEDKKKELYAEIEDLILSYTSTDSDYTYYKFETSNIQLAGEYLLTAKSQGTDFGKNNKYIIVYSADVYYPKKGITEKVYFPVEYDGIVSLPNGEYVITESKGVQGHSNFMDNRNDTNGYVDGEEMFKNLVTANRDKYTYEVSEGLKEFGE